MEEVSGQRRFSFRVAMTATVTIEGLRASEAREALVGMFEGATARISMGVGVGVELVDLRISRDVTLVLVDGVDPVAPIEEALSRFRGDGGEGE